MGTKSSDPTDMDFIEFLHQVAYPQGTAQVIRLPNNLWFNSELVNQAIDDIPRISIKLLLGEPIDPLEEFGLRVLQALAVSHGFKFKKTD